MLEGENDTEQNNPSTGLLDDMAKESRYYDKNFTKINQRWSQILSSQKLEDIRGDLVELKEHYDAEEKQKDVIIKALYEAFERAEDQYRKALSSHFLILDEMVNTQKSRLLHIDQEFRNRLDYLRSENNFERMELTTKHKKCKQKMLEELKVLKENERSLVADEIRVHQEIVEEVRNKNLEEINNLRFSLDSKIEDIEEQFEVCHTEYKQKTSQRSDMLKEISAKDNDMMKEIKFMQRKIDILKGAIKHQKNSFHQKSSQFREKHIHMVERKNAAIERYSNTKEKMQGFRKFQHQKLKDLIKCSHSKRLELKEKCTLGERILKLYQLGQKLLEGHDGLHMISNFDQNEANTINENDEMWQLRGFCEKYNNAILSLAALTKERNSLQKQNMVLKNNLKKYKDGISVNDNVIKTHNPLMVINGKMNQLVKNTPSLCSKKPNRTGTTVVDANHAFSTFHAR